MAIKSLPKEEVKLPKPELDLPKPELDLPKPQIDLPIPRSSMTDAAGNVGQAKEEIPSVATKQNNPFRLLLKIVALLLLFILILTSGFVLLQNNAGKPIPTPSPIPTPISTDETANWKIFTNSLYSVSFKYPQNWTLGKELIGKTGRQPSTNMFSISFASCDININKNCGYAKNQISGNLSIEYPINESIENFFSSSGNGTKYQIKNIDNKNALIYNYQAQIAEGFWVYGAYLKEEDKIYKLSFSSAPGENDPTQIEKLFDQILSTFKFTQ